MPDVPLPAGPLGRVTPDEAAEALLGPDQPAWYELRLPWEKQPPWWRLIARARYRGLQERILRRELALGLTTRSWSIFPWYDPSY
jgi:hypothetical protein